MKLIICNVCVMMIMFEYFFYVLCFVDNVLIFGQCNVEWCGYGLIFEEDIVFINMSFDFIGQVCMLYMYVVEFECQFIGVMKIEDDYVYFCIECEFVNFMFVELLYYGLVFGIVYVDKDYVVMIVCNFLYVVLMLYVWSVLEMLIDM